MDLSGSPAFEYAEEILELINKKYPVFFYYVYEYDNIDLFNKSILDIYTTVDIDPNTVKNIKLKSMIKYPLKYIYFILMILSLESKE